LTLAVVRVLLGSAVTK